LPDSSREGRTLLLLRIFKPPSWLKKRQKLSLLKRILVKVQKILERGLATKGKVPHGEKARRTEQDVIEIVLSSNAREKNEEMQRTGSLAIVTR